jgi:hypothetical protein
VAVSLFLQSSGDRFSLDISSQVDVVDKAVSTAGFLYVMHCIY